MQYWRWAALGLDSSSPSSNSKLKKTELKSLINQKQQRRKTLEMHSIASLRRACPFPATSLLRFYCALNPVPGNHTVSVNFTGGESGKNGLGISSNSGSPKENVSAPFASGFRNIIHSMGQKDKETRSSKPMDFVRGVIEEDGKGFMGSPHLPRYEQNADFVHIKLMRNNTFVTVTDSKGNKKLGASSGCLPELKGGPKMSRYAAEATAEHVGRQTRNLGLKSVVMRVKGFTYFKKKRQAIMSFREGFGNLRGDQNPIVYIEDATRRPHNGCRLPKRRRI